MPDLREHSDIVEGVCYLLRKYTVIEFGLGFETSTQLSSVPAFLVIPVGKKTALSTLFEKVPDLVEKMAEMKSEKKKKEEKK